MNPTIGGGAMQVEKLRELEAEVRRQAPLILGRKVDVAILAARGAATARLLALKAHTAGPEGLAHPCPLLPDAFGHQRALQAPEPQIDKHRQLLLQYCGCPANCFFWVQRTVCF